MNDRIICKQTIELSTFVREVGARAASTPNLSVLKLTVSNFKLDKTLHSVDNRFREYNQISSVYLSDKETLCVGNVPAYVGKVPVNLQDGVISVD